jgi:hypothetical protein
MSKTYQTSPENQTKMYFRHLEMIKLKQMHKNQFALGKDKMLPDEDDEEKLEGMKSADQRSLERSSMIKKDLSPKKLQPKIPVMYVTRRANWDQYNFGGSYKERIV